MTEECSHQCSGCSADCSDRSEGPSTLQTNSKTNIKHVIGVVSGKGGVGKSLVTSLLASTMAKKGYKVGILDADITGPSIPRAFGVHDHVGADENGIIPCESKSGIKIMSANLILPQEDTPVAWRGPVVSGIITQFWGECTWGDLDVLFIDMPPGTSDVFLTVFQALPVDGIITVSAPQELVAMIVGKAVNLAHELDVEVLGLIENMAYFECDECGKKHFIYGTPQAEIVADRYDIPACATLPINPEFSKLCDRGAIEKADIGEALDSIISQIDVVLEAEEE